MITATKNKLKTGFTLVEIALAILVFTMGILTIIGLFSAGLNQNAKAIADTQSAMFADNVFNGLRSKCLSISESAKSNEWENFWVKFKNGETNITVAAGATDGVWANPESLRIDGRNTVHTNVYTNYLFRPVTGATNIVNHALRYRLDIKLTNALASTIWTNRADVTLHVWNGEFGSTASDQEGHVFFTLFVDQGDL